MSKNGFAGSKEQNGPVTINGGEPRYFNPKPAEKVNPKPKKKKGKKKKKAKKLQFKSVGDGFYTSKEWRRLRYRVLRSYKAQCMCCGESPKKHGIVLHVDHIKPRSKNPELELDISNLQILCEACNLGKSNFDSIDWRP